MAAVVHLRPSPKFPSAARAVGARPIGAPADRPELHLVHGGLSEHAVHMRRVYLRRRVLAALVVGLTVLALVGVGRVVVAAWTDPALAGPTTAASIQGESYVVDSGDSLWSIAARFEPAADRREVIERIVAVNPEAAESLRRGELRPGQLLQLPG